MEKIKRNKPIIILSIIFLFIVFIGYIYYKKFYVFKDPYRIKKLVLSYGSCGILIFLLFQVIQVIAFFIPGEVMQIASGYIYGTFIGSLVSIIGITIGSIIVFYISKIYGKPFIDKIISTKDLKFFEKVLNIGNINYIVFLLYIIPGIPKDVLAYICGVSKIKAKDFLFFSTLGRLPGILASSYFGANIQGGNKIVLIIIGVLSCILFFVGILNKEKIIKGVNK